MKQLSILGLSILLTSCSTLYEVTEVNKTCEEVTENRIKKHNTFMIRRNVINKEIIKERIDLPVDTFIYNLDTVKY